MQQVELAKPSDFAQIIDLIKSCKLSTEYFEKADLWLVKRDAPEHIAGCMALERRGSRVHIQSLSVKKELRRQGVARGLIEYAFDNYLSPGESLIALTLFWNNKFYQRVRFHTANATEIKMADDVGSREKHRHCTAFVREKV